VDASRNARRNRVTRKFLLKRCAVLACWILFPATALSSTLNFAPENTGRVVIVHDPEATSAFQARSGRVRMMVERGVTNVTGISQAGEAWRSLVSPGETVGIKVVSSPGSTSGTRLEVVGAVVEGLLEAGHPKEKILIWDKRVAHLRRAGFDELAARYGIRLAGSADEGFDETIFYEPEAPFLGRLVWGDHEFGKTGEKVGRWSFVSKLLTREISKVIQVTPLLNHNMTGVAGAISTMALGSVDNTLRFESHPPALAMALPEIYALPEVGDKVVLNIMDALICQYQGEERALLHYSTMLNEIWFSFDPVALDVLALHELDRQRQRAKIGSRRPNLQIYSNAALLQLGTDDPRAIRIFRVE
jgi:hypothetical protein